MSDEIKAKIKAALLGKSEAEMLTIALQAGERHGAKHQYKLLCVYEQVAIENGAPVGTGLGAAILYQQFHSIDRFGEKVHCLSEKQIAAIIRQHHAWFNREDK